MTAPTFKPNQEYLVLQKMAEYTLAGVKPTAKLLYQNIPNMNDNGVSRVLNALKTKNRVQKGPGYPAKWRLTDSANNVLSELKHLESIGNSTIPRAAGHVARLADGMAHATPQQKKEFNKAISARVVLPSKQSAKQTAKRDLIKQLDDLPPVANNAIDAVSELIKENNRLRTLLQDIQKSINLTLGG